MDSKRGIPFSSLKVGQTFDFISGHFDSFFLRCTKVSACKYQDETGQVHKVGTVRAFVYHIGEEVQS